MTLQLGRTYRRLGHTVEFFSFDDLPKLTNKVYQVVFPWFLASYLSKRYRDFDVIDASSGDLAVWLGRHLRRTGPLCLVRSHGLEHTTYMELAKEVALGNRKVSWKYSLYHGGYRLWEVGRSFRLADISLFLNSIDRDYATRILRVDPSRAFVVANGIPDELIGLPLPVCRDEGERIGIVQIGSYIRRKGVSYSVPALIEIMERFSKVRVTFLGTGVGHDIVLADFPVHLHERIFVKSRYSRNELPLLLQDQHIKLLPSLSEGFGLALIEAMACGLAPIATQVGGPSEIISDGENGILIPPADSNAIFTAISVLIEQPSYLCALRKNAYETAQRYAWSVIAQSMLSLYEKGDLYGRRYTLGNRSTDSRP